MNPRLVEPGFVVVCVYTRTSPLVPIRRTTTATTTRRFSGDMGWTSDDNPARPGRASRGRTDVQNAAERGSRDAHGAGVDGSVVPALRLFAVEQPRFGFLQSDVVSSVS